MSSFKQTLCSFVCLSLLVFAWNISIAQKIDAEVSSDFTFYAVYQNLLNTNSHGINVEKLDMSGDANKIIFTARDHTTNDLLLYTIDPDGSNLTSIALPNDITYIWKVAITRDGSRAFFDSDSYVYKIEGDAVIQIYDPQDHPELGTFNSMQITSEGDLIFIRKNVSHTGAIWKMSHDGSGVQKVFEDKEITQDGGGAGAGITEFAVSDDAGVIAFILEGYRDEQDAFHYKSEVFVMTGGEERQLTNDDNILKTNIAISGDGDVVVYGTKNLFWEVAKSDGSWLDLLTLKSFDVAGPALTYDGIQMFYCDDLANGGRMISTVYRGSATGYEMMDLFPHTYPHVLYASYALDAGDFGKVICFRDKVGTDYFALYTGYLDGVTEVPDAPRIESITFDPLAMPKNDPSARIILTCEINDAQGLEDIAITATDVLLKGVREVPGSADIPVRFWQRMHDDGSAPDQTAGDGIFSAEGQPGPAIAGYDEVTVRVGVMDMAGNVAVANTILPIGDAPVKVTNQKQVPETFVLQQNYPNPFNPSTTIRYQIPQPGHVRLTIYDIEGREVLRLIDRDMPAGYFNVLWDGKNSENKPVASGMYLYSLKAKELVLTRKMILLQ